MSSKTDEKRADFAEWTGKCLEQGVIPWQSPPVPTAVPESAVSGRPYKGLNALYLLKPIREEGFTDSRWITVKDANKQGSKVKAGSKGVSLEYWGTRGDKVGAHSYSVFNVEQLDSFPAREPDMRPNYDRADAILKKAGADIPKNRDEKSYCTALEKTLADAAEKTPLFNDVHTQDLKALRMTVANTFLMWETHIRTTQDIPKDTTRSWAASIKHNPAELFKAIRDAGKLIGEMTKGLEFSQNRPAMEREAALPQTETGKKEKPVIPKIGDRVTFRVKEGSASLTGEVTGMDDFKGTVTMKCGDKSIPVFRGKGSFFEAPPLAREETKEYAKAAAQKHVGEEGKVFFARDDGVYKGVIVELTPTFALQEVNAKTIVLHRLKDLAGNESQIRKGQDVAINKEAGSATVSLNQRQQVRRETSGVER
jgi:antirestriction protein ArdC